MAVNIYVLIISCVYLYANLFLYSTIVYLHFVGVISKVISKWHIIEVEVNKKNVNNIIPRMHYFMASGAEPNR